jgi:DNA modification methylase
LLNRIGVGIDINYEDLNIAKKRLQFNFEDKYKPKLIKANSTNLKGIVPDNSVDFIFAHPPYGDIIKYSQDIKEDISRLELNEFLNQIEFFSKECFRILKKEKFCSILIGDIRKKGNFIPLGFQLMSIFINSGFKLKEIIIKEQHNCKGTKKWEGKVNKFYLLAHEYIFIFIK